MQNGFQNEFDFVKSFNNKRVCELNPIQQELVHSIFNNISDDDLIKSWKNHLDQKTDIFLKIDKAMKGISIKMGSRNSVHVEHIDSFISFLKEHKIPKKIINKYLKFHYADGSKNNTGLKRLSAEEYNYFPQTSYGNVYITREPVSYTESVSIAGEKSRIYIPDHNYLHFEMLDGLKRMVSVTGDSTSGSGAGGTAATGFFALVDSAGYTIRYTGSQSIGITLTSGSAYYKIISTTGNGGNITTTDTDISGIYGAKFYENWEIAGTKVEVDRYRSMLIARGIVKTQNEKPYGFAVDAENLTEEQFYRIVVFFIENCRNQTMKNK